ncbi:hypothetical protein PVOR_01930 [Paenibacillus vortex V453]|uniref:Uncharacterized protein n=1 Tax=Paenibacillus vortex V453 TaxID=715225 RepID=A0A2R9T2M1_9BACL|nr:MULTISPECIES: hypothetical protein [Paenibacillus]EFU43925.1 hypothetical protein PVOR_01930 [Paenibacillus vortex V453]MDH6673653.1 hypothetical protein [Paenibacillus sp. LBL]
MGKRFRLPLNLQLFAEEIEGEEQPPAESDIDALTGRIDELTTAIKRQTLAKLGLKPEEIDYAIEHIDADNERDILAAISEFGDDLPVLVRVKQLQQLSVHGADPNLNNGFRQMPKQIDYAAKAKQTIERLKASGRIRR